MQNRKNTNKLIYKTETDSETSKTVLSKGKLGGVRDKSEAWDKHTHTAIHKLDNQQGSTV